MGPSGQSLPPELADTSELMGSVSAFTVARQAKDDADRAMEREKDRRRRANAQTIMGHQHVRGD